MFGIGLPELVVIAVIALFVIGPRDIPKMAQDLGRFVQKMRRTAEEFKGSVEEEIHRSDYPPEPGSKPKIFPFKEP